MGLKPHSLLVDNKQLHWDRWVRVEGTEEGQPVCSLFTCEKSKTSPSLREQPSWVTQRLIFRNLFSPYIFPGDTKLDSMGNLLLANEAPGCIILVTVQ